MDIKTLLDNLHEEVSCSVCMCKYTDPKQLPCLHSFCLHCLSGIQRTSASRDKIACPECRQEFRAPGNGNLNALPTNFRINSLLDVLAIKECNTTGVKCGNCDETSEQCLYCFQCFAFWCDKCISLHNGIKAFREHYALALKDFQDQDFENILKRPAFCQERHHEKEELKFFCTDCEVAICNSCVATIHDGHAKMVLEGAANERKLQLKLAIDSQKQKVQSKMEKIAKLDDHCVKIQEQAATAKINVEKFADNIIASIQTKKMQLFVDVENKMRESLECLGIQRHQIEQQVQMHVRKIEKAETILQRSTSAQVMQPANDLLDKMSHEEGDEEGTTEGSYSRSFTELIFEVNQDLFDHMSDENVGSVFLYKPSARILTAEGKGISEVIVGLEAQIVVTTRTADREQCYEERDYVMLEITDRQGHDCATKAQVQDNKDGTYKITYYAKKTGRCEASVKVNGEHVHGSPFEVQVRPREFRPQLSFGQKGSSAGMLSHPWGVAVNERNEIAVTEVGNHRIQVFSNSGTHLRSFGRKGVKQGEFNYPTGIAFHNDKIIVVDDSNHRVQLLSDQGEYLDQFGEEGSLNAQLKFPCGLSIDSDDNIIIADKDNKLLKIFSSGGQFLRKIGAKGSFTYPFHCIQHEDYLIVSDRGEDCVKCFHRDGKFLYQFGKKGKEDGEFNEPGCLSVNKAGHLMVCDGGNHRVQVFELSGKFITKFGRKGSGIGELTRPVSTAVLNDGRIVVSDNNNHRIQIFE